MPRFKSLIPSFFYESLAQLVEHLTFNQGVVGSSPTWLTLLYTRYAVMAELADALDSGSSGVTTVEVRVLLTAPLAEVAQR